MKPTFEEIHRDFGPAVSRQVASYLPPGQNREDLVQDIWLAIWRALPRFRGDSSTKTYLFRIVHNRAMTWLTRRRTLPVSDDLDRLSDSRPSPEQSLASQQRSDQLMSAIRALSPGQRQVFILLLEGLSHAEIADILNVSTSAVGVRIHRARTHLRTTLGVQHGR
ncbi:MAG: RNA polymerase sigma-70 factor (ECF subfamily) [Myxococcota bacterium]|jgi:RNA polymerase sigma-70 factor (ECF subfamily)